jgi:hypothetical protein
VAALPVALIGLVVLIAGLVNDSDLWLLGLGACSAASLTSAVAVFRMQTRGTSRRRRQRALIRATPRDPVEGHVWP